MGRALALLALVELGACDAARATPDRDTTPPTAQLRSGLPAPAGWLYLPDVAKAAREGLGSTVTVHGVEAWGESARGCYALWLSVASKGSAEQIATEILGGLAKPGTADSGSGSGSANAVEPISVRDVVKPTGPDQLGDGLLKLAFSRGPFEGKLAAKLGNGNTVAVACFSNQREPKSCEAGCTSLLGAIR